MNEHDLATYRDLLRARNKEIRLLRLAVYRYGDRLRMATVEPAELQQAIDRAMEEAE